MAVGHITVTLIVFLAMISFLRLLGLSILSSFLSLKVMSIHLIFVFIRVFLCFFSDTLFGRCKFRFMFT